MGDGDGQEPLLIIPALDKVSNVESLQGHQTRILDS